MLWSTKCGGIFCLHHGDKREPMLPVLACTAPGLMFSFPLPLVIIGGVVMWWLLSTKVALYLSFNDEVSKGLRLKRGE